MTGNDRIAFGPVRFYDEGMPKKKTADKVREKIAVPVVGDADLRPVRNKKNQMILAALGILILVLIGFGVAFKQYQGKESYSMNNAVDLDSQKVLEALQRLMVLPNDEVPTFATVSDKSKLQGQPFFVHAENGDKVVIYAKARKVILYRPAVNKIINVTDVNIAQPTPSTESQKMIEWSSIRIAIYNGTNVPGLAGNVEAKLKNKFPGIAVAQKANAAERSYKKTMVVDVSGAHTQEAAMIATALNAEVSKTVPTTEATPTGTDILIIAGE